MNRLRGGWHLPRSKAVKHRLFFIFRSDQADLIFGDKTYTSCGRWRRYPFSCPFSRFTSVSEPATIKLIYNPRVNIVFTFTFTLCSRGCRTNRTIWSSFGAQATKVTFSDNLISSLVNATSSIASKTPENAEKGFLFTVEVSLEDETQNGNMKKRSPDYP